VGKAGKGVGGLGIKWLEQCNLRVVIWKDAQVSDLFGWLKVRHEAAVVETDLKLRNRVVIKVNRA